MRVFGQDRSTLKRLARIVRVSGIDAAAIVLAPSSEQAGSSALSARDVHKRVVKDVRRVIEAPRYLHRAHVSAYRSFYHGRSYYSPHHHYHAVYRYPVYYGGHVSYRPYSYCNNSLFITAGVPLPRLVVNVGPGGYYYGPAALPPPPPGYYPGPYGYGYGYPSPYRYDDRDRNDDRYRNDDRDRYDDQDRDDDHDRGYEEYDD